MFDWSGIIRDVIKPGVEDSRFVKPWQDLVSRFTEDTDVRGGPNISRDIRTSATTNARNFTKADVDPIAGTQTIVTAYWTKIYQETAAEVHGIDISQGQNGGSTVVDMVQKAIEVEMDGLWEKIYTDCMTQIKADLLASGTYSDAALNRSTYTTLAPYNEVTDTQITIGLMRACMYGTTLNKNTSPPEGYRIIMEPAVYYPFKPQVALLHSWTINDQGAGQPVNGGYQDIGNFEGSPLSTLQGMTTGDVFYVRPQDVYIQRHLPLEITAVQSGRYSYKFIIRTGINAYVLNVGKQGYMSNKD